MGSLRAGRCSILLTFAKCELPRAVLLNPHGHDGTDGGIYVCDGLEQRLVHRGKIAIRADGDRAGENRDGGHAKAETQLIDREICRFSILLP
jgi:hypothetical protein